MKYPIWERFSPAARRAAATAKYVQGVGGGFARTVDHCCPLAVALAADGVAIPIVWRIFTRWQQPGGLMVAAAFLDDAVGPLASKFIADWDGGKIQPRDLTKLLEVGP